MELITQPTVMLVEGGWSSTESIAAIATAAAALLAYAVSRRQTALQDFQVRIELFRLRIGVYNATMAAVNSTEPWDAELQEKLDEANGVAYWLFPSAIASGVAAIASEYSRLKPREFDGFYGTEHQRHMHQQELRLDVARQVNSVFFDIAPAFEELLSLNRGPVDAGAVLLRTIETMNARLAGGGACDCRRCKHP